VAGSLIPSGCTWGSSTDGFDGIDATRTHAAVITHSINVYAVVGRVRFDLEEDRLALVDADVVAKSLNRRIAPAVNVPLCRGSARQAVFLDDAVVRLSALLHLFLAHRIPLSLFD